MKNFNLISRKNRFTFLRTTTALAAIACISASGSQAQSLPTPKSYTCYRAGKDMTIDGKLNEQSWKKAAWTDSFVDIEGDKKPLPLQETRVKMLWDDRNLYIAAQIEEEHIWAYQDKKDQIVYLENDFEVFIDPDGDTDNYYELEVNAINNTFDLFLPKPYRKGGKAQIKWDIEGLKTAVSIVGTVNNAKDNDKRWFVEIAIPFESLSTETVKPHIPADGSEWRINFSRVNWQHEVDEAGRYTRKRNAETGKVIPEYNWVWSPQGIINMHYPEYWGKLHFSGEAVGKAK
ncbi:MAG: carbohydrate-binding family 9-like protein [Dyadobacter fermentans]